MHCHCGTNSRAPRHGGHSRNPAKVKKKYYEDAIFKMLESPNEVPEGEVCIPMGRNGTNRYID